MDKIRYFLVIKSGVLPFQDSPVIVGYAELDKQTKGEIIVLAGSQISDSLKGRIPFRIAEVISGSRDARINNILVLDKIDESLNELVSFCLQSCALTTG